MQLQVRRSLACLITRRLGSTCAFETVHELGHQLHAYGDSGLLPEGKRAESEIIRLGLEDNVFLSNHIVHMYLKCNSIPDARRKFDQMTSRNVVLWTAMLTAYARSGDPEQGVSIFQRMLLHGISPNKITFLCLLGSCSSLQLLKCVHRLITESGLGAEVSVTTALVNAYSKCGSLPSAVAVFDQMPERNLVSWSIIIAACNDHHQPLAALKFFHHMQLQGVAPDTITFVTILDVCSSCDCPPVPRDMVMRFATEVETNVIVGTALITSCRSLSEARLVFGRMKVKNVVTWTALITAHSNHGDFDGAFIVFQRMQLEGVSPNAVVFVNLLNACDEAESGERVHGLVIESGAENNTVLGNAIVSMYGKCGRADAAREYFEKVVSFGGDRDLVLWNGMFAAYAVMGHFLQALELFTRMLLLGVKPNKATYASLLMHSRRSFRASPRHLNLIRLCAEETGLKDSIAVLITTGSSLADFHDAIWWTTLIAESEEQGCYPECRLHFGRMQLEGVRPNELTVATVLYVLDLKRGRLLHQLIVDSGVVIDIAVGTALINLYSRSQQAEEGEKVFSCMRQHNTVSWTAMILCYTHNQLNFPALHLYRLMHLEGFKPDAKTFTTILSACCSSSNSIVLPLQEIKSIHSCVRESGYLTNHYVNTTLLSVYSRCGTLEEASGMFERSDPLHTSSWSSMIGAASRHGCSGSALLIFTRMMQEGARADDITFLSLLAACSHAGLAERALSYFVFMSHDFGVERNAEHFSCVADMLGRAGRLEDAEELIRKMPFQSCLPTWMTLLGACRTQGDLQRAKQASARVSSLNPHHAQSYLVLSNTYAEGACRAKQ